MKKKGLHNNKGESLFSQENPLPSRKTNCIRRLLKWGRRLFSCDPDINTSYHPLATQRRMHVPKGHIAVYVGNKDGEVTRVLVPVMHVNHPLFGELLKAAEEEFGFGQSGVITIPCDLSEFETVQLHIRKACRTR